MSRVSERGVSGAGDSCPSSTGQAAGGLWPRSQMAHGKYFIHVMKKRDRERQPRGSAILALRQKCNGLGSFSQTQISTQDRTYAKRTNDTETRSPEEQTHDTCRAKARGARHTHRSCADVLMSCFRCYGQLMAPPSPRAARIWSRRTRPRRRGTPRARGRSP